MINTKTMLNSLDGLFFALILTSVILYKLIYVTSFFSNKEKHFRMLLISNIIAIILEFIAFLLIGKTHSFFLIIQQIINILIYFITPFITYFWLLYTFETIGYSIIKIKNIAQISAIPLIINTILLLTNPFTNLYFSISNNGNFSRGPFFILESSVNFLYGIVIIILIIHHRAIIKKRIFISIILYSILPFLGGIIQSLYLGTLLVWPSISLTLLIVYIFVQENFQKLDPLTNTLNRFAFEKYIQSTSKLTKSKFNIYLIDIDNFKYINDTYGHSIGDEVLIETAKRLKKAFSNEAIIARYGGDEFIIIEYTNIAQKREPIIRLQKEINKINLASKFQHEIDLSIGCLQDQTLADTKIDKIFQIIDNKMYEAKREKTFNRRTSDWRAL